MITKVVTNSFDFGETAAQLVPLYSRGVDGDWLCKHASYQGVFHDVLQDLKPIPGKTVIHVIALGDEEIYGPNRNGDGFSRKDNVTAHKTFKELGNVFKNHQNNDPLKAAGDVIATAHHQNMSRVQLLLGLDNDKCRREVDALDKGEDVPVSMGSMQDFDVCSVCQHKAPTAADHCHHIKNMLGQLLSDGRKVYMQNPNPKYFDISLVFKPADRIAYTLKKVAAAGGGVIGGHELAEIYGLRAVGDPKYATLRALAAMYKEVPATLRKATGPEELSEETTTELQKQAKIHGMDHLLAFLHANDWLLSPEDFGSVIGHPSPGGCGQAVEEHGALDDLVDDHSEVKALEVPAVSDYIPLSESARADLDTRTSMKPDSANARVIRMTIMKTPKLAKQALDEHEARGFAALYGHYKLAFAAQHQTEHAVLKTVAATF